jgi:hypothetical protein
MKRAFFIGFGYYAIFGFLSMWSMVARQQLDLATAIIFSVILPIVGVVSFRLASRHPPNKSWFHAIPGWLLGFVSAFATFLVCAYTFYVIYSEYDFYVTFHHFSFQSPGE